MIYIAANKDTLFSIQLLYSPLFIEVDRMSNLLWLPSSPRFHIDRDYRLAISSHFASKWETNSSHFKTQFPIVWSAL